MGVISPVNASAVVVDANVLVSLCAKEVGKYPVALAQIRQYASAGCVFYAPGVLIAECLYALCRQLASQLLAPADHAIAVQTLDNYLQSIQPPPFGDSALMRRAEEVRGSYGCSHSADGLYIALAEALSVGGAAELVTFDVDLRKQALANAPTVSVRLLSP